MSLAASFAAASLRTEPPGCRVLCSVQFPWRTPFHRRPAIEGGQKACFVAGGRDLLVFAEMTGTQLGVRRGGMNPSGSVHAATVARSPWFLRSRRCDARHSARRSTSPPCSQARSSASRRSTTAFGSSPSSITISAISIWSRRLCNPSTTPSARVCHPCLRYVLSPICPGRTFSILERAKGFEPRAQPWQAITE